MYAQSVSLWTGESVQSARAAKQSEPGTCAQSASAQFIFLKLLDLWWKMIYTTIKAERPTGWLDHQSGSGNSGESYREGFGPAKVEVDGLFF